MEKNLQIEKNEKFKFSLREWKEVFFESDELFKLPKKVKQIIIKAYALQAVQMASRRFPAIFLAIATTTFVTNPMLGICLLIISIMFNSLSDTIGLSFRDTQDTKEAYLVEYLENIASKMLAPTRNRVEKESLDGKIQILTTTVTVDIIKNRFRYKFSIIEQTFNNIISCVIFGFTLVSLLTLLNEHSADMLFFYIVIIASFILKILIFSKELKRINENYDERIETRVKLSNAARDLREVEPMNNKHIKFLLEQLLKCQNTSLTYERKELKERNKNSLLVSFINSLAIISVIVKFAFEGGIDNLALINLASLISLSQLFSNILNSIEGTVRNLYSQKDIMILYQKQQEYYILVYNVYKMYADDVEVPYEGDVYIVEPFEYTYSNTKFTMRSLVELVFKRGEFTLLDCASGGGKSTTAKIAIGEIKVGTKKAKKIPAVKYFNDESSLGSGNLLEEITLEVNESNIDYNKLFEIIEGIKLSDKFKTVEELKKTCGIELSNGMYQRMLLARTLYNLGQSDMVIIDEPIGSLDKKTAVEVMRFVKEFCNKDKKRFGIVCTHQAEFIEKFLDKTYTINSLSPTLSEIM